MFGKKSAADEPRMETTEHAELWLPSDLSDVYAELAPTVRQRLTPLDAEAGWFDALAGWTEFNRHKSLADVAGAGPLGLHLRAMLIATRYDGSEPGSVPPPPQIEMKMRPLRHASGEVSSMFERLEQVLPGESPERDAQRAAHLKSVRARPEFLESARELALEVLADRQRAWAAHVHLAVIAEARRVLDVRTAAWEAEQARLAVQQCPECLESDPLTIGSIALRPLLPGAIHVYEGVPSLRSCLACWNVASTLHVAQLGSKIMPTGRARREHFARSSTAD